MTDFDTPLSADAANQNSRVLLKEKWARTPLLIAIAIPLLFIIAAFVFIGLSLSKDKVAAEKGVAEYFAPQSDTKDAEIAQLQTQIKTLQNPAPGISPLANAPATSAPSPVYAPDPSTVARLSERIDRLEANQRYLAQAAASASAAATLQQAARGSMPFSGELAIAERTLTDAAILNPLHALAEKGVPSEAGLAVDFPQYAAKAHVTAKAEKGDGSIWQQIRNAFGSLISVRKISTSDGTDMDAILVKAETRLNQGDLAGAVTYLESLPAGTQNALKPWLDQARSRVLIDTTTRRVTELALNRLSQVNADPLIVSQTAAGGQP